MHDFFLISVLLGALCINANAHAHKYINVVGCNNINSDPEEMLALDGDEILYVDFEKNEMVSTVADFLGHWSAPDWVQAAHRDQQLCMYNLAVVAQHENETPEQIDPPQVTVYTRNKVELSRSNILICFVNNFYPPSVKVKWTKNNVEVKEGVTLSSYYSNSDFTFRQYSTLQFTPQKGDDYSCTVYHKGLTDPETRFWEPEIWEESDAGEIAFCGIGLTLGLLGVGAGIFFLIKGNNCS